MKLLLGSIVVLALGAFVILQRGQLAHLEQDRQEQEVVQQAAAAATAARQAQEEAQRQQQASQHQRELDQEAARVAQQVREAREKEAARTALRQAEEKVQAQAQQALAEAAAAKKREAEYDNDGLVLLRNTVKGTQNTPLTTRLTGIVVNRRTKTLTHALIRFDIFDADGNRVGTARDSIDHLSPGQTWSFTATGLSGGGSKYGVSELTGYSW